MLNQKAACPFFWIMAILKWGGATAANQWEGAWQESGKGLCVADINEFMGDLPLEERNNHNFTIAEVQALMEDKNKYFPKWVGLDFYHNYKEDIALLAGMGIKSIRTSINWTRINPNSAIKSR